MTTMQTMKLTPAAWEDIQGNFHQLEGNVEMGLTEVSYSFSDCELSDDSLKGPAGLFADMADMVELYITEATDLHDFECMEPSDQRVALRDARKLVKSRFLLMERLYKVAGKTDQAQEAHNDAFTVDAWTPEELGA